MANAHPTTGAGAWIKPAESMLIIPSMIEQATVYIQPLPHNNRKFATKYYGRDCDLVVNRANQAVAAIDMYASPHASWPHLVGEFWEVVVTYYSVD